MFGAAGFDVKSLHAKIGELTLENVEGDVVRTTRGPPRAPRQCVPGQGSEASGYTAAPPATRRLWGGFSISQKERAPGSWPAPGTL